MATFIWLVACSHPTWREPVVYLADEAVAARGLATTPAATIGSRTEYVLNEMGPRSLELEKPSGTLRSPDAGRANVTARCPPEWRGRHILLDVTTVSLPRDANDLLGSDGPTWLRHV
jgi:hypothetical protein